MSQSGELESIPGSVPNLVDPPTGCRFHPRCPRAGEICGEVLPPLEEMSPGHFAACHFPINEER
jgi:peptide/nickel transport system ATP-binding protein